MIGIFVVAGALAAESYDNLVKRFDYDRNAPLDVREVGVEDRGGIMVRDLSYESPKGGRVPAYLVVPAGKGPFAAAIWGHWYWGNSPQRNRTEFLDEAVVLAKSGLLSLLYDGPIARPGHVADPEPLGEQQIRDRIQTILDVRRGADLLLKRADVDPARLAFVGHSYNASTGGYLSGIDKRFKAFVLMAGSLSDKVDLESKGYKDARLRIGPEKWDAFMTKWQWLDPGLYTPHASPAVVFMQYATHEDYLTVERAREYAALVSEPKEFKAYESNHALNAEARRDRVEFLRKQLHLDPIDWDAVAKVPQLVQPAEPKS
jgi:dienelactone hydrolase